MQKTLPLYVSLILLASCTRYQYGTIQSTVIPGNKQLEFVAESDSLRLVYNFNGLNAPVNLTIYNKLNVPVAIDWQRSSLIMGDVAYSYVPDKVPINGSFDGTTSTTATNPVNGYAYTSGSGTIQASATVPEQLAFIPPQTRIVKTPISITKTFLKNVPDTAYHRVKHTLDDGITIFVKKATFTEANSPLRFKSYLTVKVGHEATVPVVYQHSFYVSELINTGQSPFRMWMGGPPPGNQYYVGHTSGVAGAVIGIGLASVAMIGIASQNNNPTPD
jgi:hypothetical protein